MRKALIVGIDYYQHMSCLEGCVNDAHSVKATLERHADGTINFVQPRILTGTGPTDTVERAALREAVRELFADDSDIALFYFAGHGYIEDSLGFLCASDTKTGDDGVSLYEVMTQASKSPSKNRIVILDSCHAGIAGDRATAKGFAEIAAGMTVLTASTAEQYAVEGQQNGVPGGLFTSLLIDALGGAAANLVGDITPGSVYAHIDQSLGSWAQRPVFKTNVKTFVSLRKAAPPIALAELQALATHFPSPGFEFQLDPSYEPERSEAQRNDPGLPLPDPGNTATFKILQNYVKVNLVRPVDVPHMWHAAMQSKSCKLTAFGEHYRNLVAQNLI
jgi:hypothetical protein